jgi:5-methylcytosine-specific restriction endonuclease McrA
MKKCKSCKILPVEIDTKNRRIRPSREFCRDCRRFQELFLHPERIEQTEKRREKRKDRKNKFKEYINLCSNNLNIKKTLVSNDEKRKVLFKQRAAKTRVHRKKGQIEIADEEKLAIKEFYRLCPKDFHIDHIIPISIGGKHCLENLQYLPATENISKGAKLDLELLEKLNGNIPISNSYLQRKFKLTAEEAQKIMAMI